MKRIFKNFLSKKEEKQVDKQTIGSDLKSSNEDNVITEDIKRRTFNQLSTKYGIPNLARYVSNKKYRLKIAAQWIDKGITDKAIQNVKEFYIEELGFELEERIIVKVIYHDDYFTSELNEYGFISKQYHGREVALNALSLYFMGCLWPKDNDKIITKGNKQIELFINNLKDNIYSTSLKINRL